MSEVAIVTGAGSGIGRAVARGLAETAELEVLCVGRRVGPLQDTAALDRQRLQPISADVASDEGRQRIVDAVGDRRVRFLVHNAGVLAPVGPLSRVSLKEWRGHMAVNVEGPLFLTQSLLPALVGGRVLHVSSGAAHRPVPGWGAYCTGKAALHMLYRVLAAELDAEGVAVGSVRPGVVDTPMQELIREQTAESFPGVERFREMKARGELVSPEQVARFILALLTDLTTERFSEREWDIREHAAELGL
ncbi:MAG: SDR family NAD(P)-dependent oxidoreductase [Ectothiorhodospiraceae bacterium]|jgi:NAD(P)-dependent dehydrogenase (short-subunit alcohol dehydrogenase family)